MALVAFTRQAGAPAAEVTDEVRRIVALDHPVTGERSLWVEIAFALPRGRTRTEGDYVSDAVQETIYNDEAYTFDQKMYMAAQDVHATLTARLGL